MRKVLSLWLVLALCVSMLAGVSFATEIIDSGTCGGNASWTLNSDGVLTIEGSGAMYNWATYPWSDKRENIRSVVIAEGITTIGAGAFKECFNLTRICIANSVTKICADAFACCTSITEISIPKKVTEISSGVFAGCDALEKITIPQINKLGNLFGYQTKTVSIKYGSYRTDYTLNGSYRYPEVYYPDIDEAYTTGSEVPENTAYQNDSSTRTSTQESSIPYTVDCYSHRTYYYYKIPASLKKVTITNDTEVNDSAFCNCANLEEVKLNDEISKIGDNAFFGCTGLMKITIPRDVTSIGNFAFYNCEAIIDVQYNGNEEKKASISIGKSNDSLEKATWHYNYLEPSEVRLSTVNGAQIRTKGNQGLRFISSIQKSDDFEHVTEYGILLIPSDDISDISELQIGATFNGHTVAKVPAKAIYDETESAVTFTAVITNIAVKNYTRSYTARAYAIFDNGTIVYSDSGASRSIYQVAERGLQDPYASAENKAVFQAIVDAVSNDDTWGGIY